MKSFPSSIKEIPPSVQQEQIRERIFQTAFSDNEPTEKPFFCADRQVMQELLELRPNTLQVWDEYVSGLDDAPTGNYYWAAVSPYTLAGGWDALPRPRQFRIVK